MTAGEAIWVDEWQRETVGVRGSLEFKGFDEEEEEQEEEEQEEEEQEEEAAATTTVADAAKTREGEKCKDCLHKNG